MMSKKRKDKSKKSRSHNKFLIVFVGLLIVSVIGVGSFFGFRYLFNKKQPNDNTSQEQTLDSQVQAKIYLGDIEEAYKLVDEAIERAGSDTEALISAYMTKGNALYNEKKYTEAIEVYEKVVLLQEGSGKAGTYSVIADSYRSLKNKVKANEYVDKAISCLDKNSQYYNTELQSLNNKKKAIQQNL